MNAAINLPQAQCGSNSLAKGHRVRLLLTIFGVASGIFTAVEI
jgi:hypothetical protein